jgi:aldehyde:ferredoxin oxidoreductase
LIIGTCVLTGTMVPAANRGIITFKSPVNGHLMHSAMGGFWPAEIKHAGYDTIIIRGKSAAPVYLWINDDDVQLRDALHLWGKGTPDTMQAIQEELENDRMHIACIGPAGENKCYIAGIESSVGAGASRGGPGAIMGDKNLKAIAVYGTRDVRVARPQRLVELCEEIMERSGPLKERVDQFAPRVIAEIVTEGIYGNLDERYMDLPPDSAFKKDLDGLHELAEEWHKKRDGSGSCHNCGFQ